MTSTWSPCYQVLTGELVGISSRVWQIGVVTAFLQHLHDVLTSSIQRAEEELGAWRYDSRRICASAGPDTADGTNLDGR